MKILNNLVSGYFNFAEAQAMRHNTMLVTDYIEHIDKVFSGSGVSFWMPGIVSKVHN